jgi:hypothetical protein
MDAAAAELDEEQHIQRRSQTVSTVRKSQAMIAEACARRNCGQLRCARLKFPQRPAPLRERHSLCRTSAPMTKHCSAMEVDSD